MSDYDEDDFVEEEYNQEEEENEVEEYDQKVEEYDREENERGVDIEGELQFSEKLNPSDFKRGIGGENIGIIREGKSGKYSDPYSIYKSQIYSKLREKEDYPEDVYSGADEITNLIPKNKLMLMNIDVLCSSLLFLAIYKKKGINSKNIEEFLKNFKYINPFDFVRYIRYISNLLS
jgi:hypothetical protein